MHYVYILESIKTGKHYTGIANNVEARLKQHNDNITRSTKNKGPYKVIHSEIFATRKEATHRERQIKRFKGNRQFKRLINKQAPIV